MKALLRARGYDDVDDGEEHEFSARKGNTVTQVRYAGKIGVAEVRDFIEAGGGILIGEASPAAEKAAAAAGVELFTLASLLINPARHRLVPKHEIVAHADGIDKRLLPWLPSTDPMARFIGAKRGQVVRITRVSAIAGEVIVYRLVV